MIKIPIKRNQVWKHKHSGKLIQVTKKHGDFWLIVSVNGEEFGGSASHKVRPQTLYTRFLCLPS